MACSDKYIKNGFGGVFASDTLPVAKKHFVSFIVNLDDHTLPGSHWVSIYFKNRIAFYFDSYGRCPPKSILNFMQKNCDDVYFNNVQVQNYFTTSCGYFCLFFILFQQK